ncbi:hypothetical protein [Niabella hibiscisoli]|uniref:hypothetical protein n=1 Tax=Niabella hibiscisoli TaxID=1825928 RepID=UPI001F0DF2E0|nr:hypothetical protein [Niabella hibiscisoli]MCH5719352.1 hypothetical protein [Niabella hibiscisoli]
MKKITLGITAALLATILFQACNKKDYYRDTGLQSGVLKENIYEFLQQKPFLFDSLVQVIDLAGMKTVLENDTITFLRRPTGLYCF